MNGLAKSYEKAIKKELSSHAAWIPVSNTLKVGDYGYFEGGVFRSMGNVKDKYPEIELIVKQGPPTSMDFTSEGTRTFKLNAAGDSINSFAGLGDTQASLKYKFTKENSIVIKAKTILVNQLQNIDKVALVLASKSNWRKKYKVVSAAYTGNKCLIVCSRESNSEFTISASANLLKEAEGGNVGIGLETTASNSSTYESVGETGVLAIRLFKLNWLKKIKLLKEGNITIDDLEIKNDFDSDLEDDF